MRIFLIAIVTLGLSAAVAARAAQNFNCEVGGRCTCVGGKTSRDCLKMGPNCKGSTYCDKKGNCWCDEKTSANSAQAGKNRVGGVR